MPISFMLFILGEVSGLLGYDAVSLGEWFQMFQKDYGAIFLNG